MSEACPFCEPRDPVLEDDLVYVLEDLYPVNHGHLLVIPRRHVADYFDCTPGEVAAIGAMLPRARAWIRERHEPEGFNVGINVGRAAGQTVFHVHVHLIPRWMGDVEEPRGGVRGVIPSRRSY